MKDNTYPYDKTQSSRYTFTSIGKKRIVKQVVFTHTGIRNIVNMGFGDVLPDGSINDKANSNTFWENRLNGNLKLSRTISWTKEL